MSGSVPQDAISLLVEKRPLGARNGDFEVPQSQQVHFRGNCTARAVRSSFIGNNIMAQFTGLNQPGAGFLNRQA